MQLFVWDVRPGYTRTNCRRSGWKGHRRSKLWSSRVLLTAQAVIHENPESTKLQIVYDASARENSRSFSLNNCLKKVLALQNLLWSILIRTRFKPIALRGDLQKAFLQIRIKAANRDALRFHWIKERDPNQVEILWFTKLIFGSVQSPVFLGGSLQEHLETYIEKYHIEVAEIKDDLYVDNLISR